jgi:biopolymer transport protein ExbD
MAWTGILGGVLLFFRAIATPPPPRGLFLKIHEQSSFTQKSPWPETMSVYVGPDNRFYVNSHPVAPESLRANLGQELGKRVVWMVYFEADDNASVANAVYAMDAIQSVEAKIIWITPKVREEYSRRDGSE